MSDITFVRVRDEFGNEFSQSTQTTLQPGCTIIDKPAADSSGNPHPWKPKVTLPPAETAATLKGAALAAALEAAGLDDSGTADEKRARLADHYATQQADPGVVTTTTEEISE